MVIHSLLQSYIDPAATSILLSSITAIVVAVGATFIVLWRKFKKGVSKALHIDPNAGKEVEDELVVSDTVAEEAAATAAQEPSAQQSEQESAPVQEEQSAATEEKTEE